VVDRASGRVLEGDPERDDEVVELWTFRRDQRAQDGWQLSAIQQT
jgi:predicted lipid-binding transport protein (Tim44 family)